MFYLNIEHFNEFYVIITLHTGLVAGDFILFQKTSVAVKDLSSITKNAFTNFVFWFSNKNSDHLAKTLLTRF